MQTPTLIARHTSVAHRVPSTTLTLTSTFVYLPRVPLARPFLILACALDVFSSVEGHAMAHTNGTGPVRSYFIVTEAASF